jgi:hypothetical protein
MSDTDAFDVALAELDSADTVDLRAESNAMDPLAAAEQMAVRKKQAGVAQMLAEKENLERLTQLRRTDPIPYAKLEYLWSFSKSIGAIDDPVLNDKGQETGMTKGFQFPDMKQLLINVDLSYKKSVGGKIIDSLVRVTHIFERGDSGGAPRGIFGRRH